MRCWEIFKVTVADAVMFLWTFSALIDVGCSDPALLLFIGCMYLHSPSLSCFFPSRSSPVPFPACSIPKVASVKNEWEIGPSGSLSIDSKIVWEMRRWRKASSRGPFQHSRQALPFGWKLCRKTRARGRIGQEAVNTLWNCCGGIKFKKCYKGKQHCIMCLLTIPCTTCRGWEKWKAFIWLLASSFFLFGHKPSAAVYSM